MNDLKVLFVDDDEITRMVLVNQLSVRYSQVFQASNGREGVEVFKESSPDIVVTDLSMPVMSGGEMIRQIREISPDQKFIVISGFSEGFEDDPAIPVVFKPISPEALFREINSLAGLE